MSIMKAKMWRLSGELQCFLLEGVPFPPPSIGKDLLQGFNRSLQLDISKNPEWGLVKQIFWGPILDPYYDLW